MKKLTLLSAWAIMVLSALYFVGFKAPKSLKTELVPNSCTAATALGAVGSIICPTGKSPNCSADMFKLKCECSGDVTNAQLSLSENNKIDALIETSLGFGTKAGELFAGNLKLHKTAIIKSDWAAYQTTATEIKKVYYVKLSRSERTSINNILLGGN